MTSGAAIAQDAAPGAQPVAPNGYTLHESIDLGGHMAGIYGSGPMYDTMVDLESGPRALGETFELHALPGAKRTLVDSLSAFSSGWGGDPDNFARLDFYKGNLYEFSGNFFRDRQYFDYDLLGNPNIPSGQSLPIGPAAAPTGSYPWSQVDQSPFLYNTVRRRTNASLTLFPVSKLSYQAGYSQDVFEGPSLTPSGYQVASSYSLLLQEMQRNSTDDFTGEIDWKPVPLTRLTFEEVVDHYKADSYFTMDPSYFNLQEPDGTRVALLTSYQGPGPVLSCNTNSVGAAPDLSAPSTPGGLPIINPACGVITSYFRSQPTRILYPTEIFRFQSSSIPNISMNGDLRYTKANMSLPLYQDIFQGLAKTTRYQDYTATASAKREVTAVDYAAEWRATRKVSFDDQFTFSNEQEPGVSTMTSEITSATPATANNETISYPTLTTTAATAGTSTFEGSSPIGTPFNGFFGQRFITNDVTGTWDGWSRATLSLTYRHVDHVIAEGESTLSGTTYVFVHSAPLAVGATTNGTVTIHQNGGVFNVALRPTDQWNIDGSAEVLYADNVFTPVAPRQQQHYRVHALYRPRAWATLSGAFNDLERHDNTDNTGAAGAFPSATYAGPLDHVDHTRVAGFGAQLFPNEHYGLDLNYAYSDVYTTTNTCFQGAASLLSNGTVAPGAAIQSGLLCNPVASAHGSTTVLFGPAKDFMDAPTQYASAAVTLSPSAKVRSSIGYRINSVNGSRFFGDARDVNGSLVSTYQSPFVDLGWTVRPGFIWKAEYNYYGYGEGGPSGAQYCNINPALSSGAVGTTVPVVPCSSVPETALSGPAYGYTAPRNFHANIVTLGFHYEF